MNEGHTVNIINFNFESLNPNYLRILEFRRTMYIVPVLSALNLEIR